MARSHILTAVEARQLLDYDPETGILTWRHLELEISDASPHHENRDLTCSDDDICLTAEEQFVEARAAVR